MSDHPPNYRICGIDTGGNCYLCELVTTDCNNYCCGKYPNFDCYLGIHHGVCDAYE